MALLESMIIYNDAVKAYKTVFAVLIIPCVILTVYLCSEIEKKYFLGNSRKEEKETKLKRCPFCGNKARVNDYGTSDRIYYFCECEKCCASMKSLPGYTDEKEAIRAWNKRTGG